MLAVALKSHTSITSVESADKEGRRMKNFTNLVRSLTVLIWLWREPTDSQPLSSQEPDPNSHKDPNHPKSRLEALTTIPRNAHPWEVLDGPYLVVKGADLVEGVGLSVEGLGFRVWGLGFRVQGLRLRD